MILFYFLANLLNTFIRVSDYLNTIIHWLHQHCSARLEYALFFVATTRQNGTHSLLTSAKLSVGYLVVGITRELDKEPSLNCSSIYINTMWSVLQQCVYLMSYYLSTILLPQSYHAMSMCPDIILFNLRYHVCTICTP